MVINPATDKTALRLGTVAGHVPKGLWGFFERGKPLRLGSLFVNNYFYTMGILDGNESIIMNTKYHVNPSDKRRAMNDAAKEEHSKNAIFMWYLLGIIFLFMGKFQMSIWGHLIFWIGGLFISSIASVVTYLLRVPIFAIMVTYKRIPGVITVTYITSWILDIIWDVITVMFLINILNRIF